MSEAQRLPTPEILSTPPEQIALQGRLLVGKDEFLDPEKSDLAPITVEQVTDRTIRDATTYTYLTHASVNERQKSWEGKNGNNFDQQKEAWVQHFQTTIQNGKDFYATENGKRWAALFGKLGLDVQNVSPDQINTFYTNYCGKDASEAQIKRFVNDVLAIYKEGDKVNLQELEKDKAAIRWLSLTMGKKSAEIIEELVSGEAQVITDPQIVVNKVNAVEGGVVTLNKLSDKEKELLAFLKEGRSLSGKKEPAVTVQVPLSVPQVTPPVVPAVPPPVSTLPITVPTVPPVVETPPVTEPTPPVHPAETPEEIARRIAEVKHEIFEKAGTRNAQEMLQLIDQVAQINKEQWDRGNGKLKGTIQETASAVGKEMIYDGGIVFIPKSEGQLVVVGDIHGDFKTVKQVIEKSQFIENMESGDKSKTLVFMGDMVDRGVHDVEVVESILELKRRYPDNVVVMKADHETIKGVSHHDFPDRVATHYYAGKPEAADPRYTPVHRELNEKIFNQLPRLVVCENGVVLAHGGPPAHKMNLEGLRKRRDIFDREIIWADPTDAEIGQRLEAAEATFKNGLNILKQKIQQALSSNTPAVEYDGKIMKVIEWENIIRAYEEKPEGIWFSAERLEEYSLPDAALMGLTKYSEAGLRQFLDTIGGKVMVRGHQTSYDVEGGKPNPFLSNILWTIHTTGKGSPESYYAGREPDPRYAVFDKEEDVTNIDENKHTVKVWS